MIMGECAYEVEVLLGTDLLVPSQGDVHVAPFEVVVGFGKIFVVFLLVASVVFIQSGV